MNIFTGSFKEIEQALNYSTLKQKTISNNIANADTPNYKAKEVSFKRAFEEAQAGGLSAYRTNERHLVFKSENSSPAVMSRNVSFNQNGNSVDIDKEMSDLATNQIYYNALVDRMSGKFNTLTSVIKGGR
ncbi:flagellar basal body rod protein FlgB [Bacillus thermotolerans]|uniref:Flagellar basal body rod protein FlgB n=1 Tax=Bacillus thermotolerans TaxID=1221996 RepID=A0A0F5IAZ7_BACTR|nr:flagellar basal body rod protein FlgB [Bacillus thermotolerans]KKB38982.1 Flagellar basal-body rod protein FlgB [Bacillus thermotolerans]KKB42352.1 Flagellar basal-body rod protein FlgB [Bacillus thermotolerans]KKB44661.1 Flagellar basal-body rod protein FlgB [Bacillus thermotolerans]